jgi:LytR cell envelope-related transcriptional attenuator
MTKAAPLKVKNPRSLALNIVLGALAILVLYLGYSLLDRHFLHPRVDPSRGEGGGVIQVDVLNGCGVSGAATEVRDYLRARGFDVVELRNYKSFDVDRSIVVDRVGDGVAADRVAAALGIPGGRIVRQINPDYYVDVSIVIGKDHRSLNSSQ